MALPEIFQKPGCISFADVRQYDDNGNLGVRASVLNLVRHQSDRICPGPAAEWIRDELYRYYSDCICAKEHECSADDAIHSRFDAAHGLVSLFEWLISGNAGGKAAGKSLVDSVTELFRTSDRVVRNCIETGFLEHVLEVPELREYFHHWNEECELADSFRAALAWGKAHPRRWVP